MKKAVWQITVQVYEKFSFRVFLLNFMLICCFLTDRPGALVRKNPYSTQTFRGVRDLAY